MELQVKSIHRLDRIECLVPGCGEKLTEKDTKGVVVRSLRAKMESELAEIEKQNEELISKLVASQDRNHAGTAGNVKEEPVVIHDHFPKISKPNQVSPAKNEDLNLPKNPQKNVKQPPPMPRPTALDLGPPPTSVWLKNHDQQTPHDEKQENNINIIENSKSSAENGHLLRPPPTQVLPGFVGKVAATGRFLAGLGTGVVQDPLTKEMVRLVVPGTTTLRPDKPVPLLTGVLGDPDVISRPCAICLQTIETQNDETKTIFFRRLPHCGVSVHKSCLNKYWAEQVRMSCNMKFVKCPGCSVANCTSDLLADDLRNIISSEDLESAKKDIAVIEQKNQALIAAITAQHKNDVAVFECAICMAEHRVEGAITLPCLHRFCAECLARHFDIIVSERRLDNLRCPLDDCQFSLRSEEHIPIFQFLLEEQKFDKLLEFLARDLSAVTQCSFCEDKIFVEEQDDFTNLICGNGHRFCARCEHGPHQGVDCATRVKMLQEKKATDDRNQAELKSRKAAFESAVADGWKPCPRRCKFGGGYKLDQDCDHVTCECGFEFCWDCGASRAVIAAHDNRYHKPSCRYFSKPEDVKEIAKRVADCPECQKLEDEAAVCAFPEDDGYPKSLLDSLGAKY